MAFTLSRRLVGLFLAPDLLEKVLGQDSNWLAWVWAISGSVSEAPRGRPSWKKVPVPMGHVTGWW